MHFRVGSMAWRHMQPAGNWAISIGVLPVDRQPAIGVSFLSECYYGHFDYHTDFLDILLEAYYCKTHIQDQQ